MHSPVTVTTFETWYTQQLQVLRYPVPGEILKLPAGSHVINVSDKYIPACHQAALTAGVFYHFLPLNECTGDVGVNSIYGAMQILQWAEENNARVLLHCHAGITRSPAVAQAYHYLRTGHHCDRQQKRSPQNALTGLIAAGLLPANFEQFLQRYAVCLQELGVSYRGGLLTQLKIETTI